MPYDVRQNERLKNDRYTDDFMGMTGNKTFYAVAWAGGTLKTF